MIWAFAAVIISGTWAYIAHQAMELLSAKLRSQDLAVLSAKHAVLSKTVEVLEGDIQRIRDRMGRLELKRS